jgi:hypothetical protein
MRPIFSYALLFFVVLSYLSCHPKLSPRQGNEAEPARALNQEVKDDRGNLNLLGESSRERLEQPPFDSWFVKNYDAYSVDSATADLLRPMLAGKHFRIFMGTWCGDSRREVPRMYKILDYCKVSRSSIQLIMVSSVDSVYKQSPGHEERGLNIFRVPDLLVSDHKKELGRIVEFPVVSLEKDLLAVAGGSPYTPNYRGAAFLNGFLGKQKPEDVEKDLQGLADRIRPLLSSPSELSSYAHVLQATGEKDRAGIVLRLNELIYPAKK